jgi:hypothetical protein
MLQSVLPQLLRGEVFVETPAVYEISRLGSTFFIAVFGINATGREAKWQRCTIPALLLAQPRSVSTDPSDQSHDHFFGDNHNGYDDDKCHHAVQHAIEANLIPEYKGDCLQNHEFG